MAGVNTVLRIIGAILFLFVLMFVSAVGVTLLDGIVPHVGAPASLNWPEFDFYFFMSLGLVGLGIVVIVWLISAPIRNDVRQEQQGPPRI